MQIKALSHQAHASAVGGTHGGDPSMRRMFEAAVADKSYQSVADAVLASKPPSMLHTAHPAKQFAGVWDNMSVSGVFLVMDGDRLVVPKSMRAEVLSQLHRGHAGITRTKQLARQHFYWPSMNNEIKQLIGSCEGCQELRASNPRPADKLRPPAAQPMERVGIDLFDCRGKSYLLMADAFSGHAWVACLSKETTAAIVSECRRWFLDFGYPKEIISDNGPQFRTDFGRFCTEEGIVHTTSSPYYPESNGMAESGVKNMKYLLLKHENEKQFRSALLAWRNTPSAGSNFSPAERFFGWRQRFGLPIYDADSATRLQSEANNNPIDTDSQHDTPIKRTRNIRKYLVGERVRVQNEKTKRWTTKAVVVAIRKSGCSYVLRFDGCSKRQLTARNSVFMRPLAKGVADEGVIGLREQAAPEAGAHPESRARPGEVGTLPEMDSGCGSEDPVLRRSARLRNARKVRFSC
jgi:hypothetical protein